MLEHVAWLNDLGITMLAVSMYISAGRKRRVWAQTEGAGENLHADSNQTVPGSWRWNARRTWGISRCRWSGRSFSWRQRSNHRRSWLNLRTCAVTELIPGNILNIHCFVIRSLHKRQLTCSCCYVNVLICAGCCCFLLRNVNSLNLRRCSLYTSCIVDAVSGQ